MQTKLLGFNPQDLSTAGKLIRDGQLVAFPTETALAAATAGLAR